jgi:hypothetical protein
MYDGECIEEADIYNRARMQTWKQLKRVKFLDDGHCWATIKALQTSQYLITTLSKVMKTHGPVVSLASKTALSAG